MTLVAAGLLVLVGGVELGLACGVERRLCAVVVTIARLEAGILRGVEVRFCSHTSAGFVSRQGYHIPFGVVGSDRIIKGRPDGAFNKSLSGVQGIVNYLNFIVNDILLKSQNSLQGWLVGCNIGHVQAANALPHGGN